MAVWQGRIAALAGGVIFGAGLVVSGMTNPDNVLAFLTLNAHWDPALIMVMGTAILVAATGFALTRRRSAPLFDTSFHAPTSQLIDRPLLGGATLFGVGWGVTGFCPGPALVGLFTLDPRALVFMLGFVGGLMLHDRWRRSGSEPQAALPDG